LEALESVARPLQVVSIASVPGSPSSPKVAEDGVIGLVLGALLGVLIGVLRTALDRRMRGADDVSAVTGLPLLGHVRETALGYAGDVPRGSERLHPRDLEGFHMLRTNVEFLSSNGSGAPRTVVVTSALAEEGKSTTAAALAFAYAASGRRTLLAECDLRMPCLADRLGLRQNGGLTSYLLGKASFSELLYQAQPPRADRSPSASEHEVTPPLAREPTMTGANGSEIVQSANGAAFAARPDILLAGPPPSHPVELLASPAFSRFLTDAKAEYDIVILDTAPLLPVADTLEILPHVEGVILCVRTARTTRDQVVACAGALSTIRAKRAGIVVTGISDRDDARYGYYGYSY
jgi:non-specific protein-tyrosine kinase